MAMKSLRTHPLISIFLPLMLNSIFIVTHAQEKSNTEQIKIAFDDDYWNYRTSITDHYYTAGVSLEYSRVAKNANSRLSRFLGILKKPSSVVYGFGLTQLIFTPDNTQTNEVAKMDYPYAGILRAHHSIISTNLERKERLTSQLHVGLVGPDSFARQTQTFVHRTIGDYKPLGWESQIDRRLDAGYSLRYEKTLLNPFKKWEVIGTGQVNAGTFFNNMTLGTNLWFSGNGNSYFSRVGVINTSGLTNGKKKMNVALNLNPAVKMVLSNGVLQDGRFNPNYHMNAPLNNDSFSMHQVKRVLMELDFGIYLQFEAWVFSLSQKIQTKEFTGLNHQEYGTLAVQFRI
jgi:lipid A 3-O-deacylase